MCGLFRHDRQRRYLLWESTGAVGEFNRARSSDGLFRVTVMIRHTPCHLQAAGVDAVNSIQVEGAATHAAPASVRAARSRSAAGRRFRIDPRGRSCASLLRRNHSVIETTDDGRRGEDAVTVPWLSPARGKLTPDPTYFFERRARPSDELFACCSGNSARRSWKVRVAEKLLR